MENKPLWVGKAKESNKVAIVKKVNLTSLWNTEKKRILARFEKVAQQKERKRAKRQERIDLMKDLRSQGFTLQQIGNVFKLSRERVRQLIK